MATQVQCTRPLFWGKYLGGWERADDEYIQKIMGFMKECGEYSASGWDSFPGSSAFYPSESTGDILDMLGDIFTRVEEAVAEIQHPRFGGDLKTATLHVRYESVTFVDEDDVTAKLAVDGWSTLHAGCVHGTQEGGVRDSKVGDGGGDATWMADVGVFICYTRTFEGKDQWQSVRARVDARG